MFDSHPSSVPSPPRPYFWSSSLAPQMGQLMEKSGSVVVDTLPIFDSHPSSISIPPRPHFLTPISTKYAYIPLLLCAFLSGATDASSFAIWGTYTAMLTGNMFLLALGASQQPPGPPYGLMKAGTAILAFLVSCFVIPRIMRGFKNGTLTRGALTACFALQAACVLVAATLTTAHVVQPVGKGSSSASGAVSPAALMELIPIALLAFQAGGQMVSSRMLGYGEIPTSLLTVACCDLASDPRLFAPNNGKRDRRLMSVVCLTSGAVLGGLITRSDARIQTVLWIVAAGKAGIALAWSMWTAEEEGKV